MSQSSANRYRSHILAFAKQLSPAAIVLSGSFRLPKTDGIVVAGMGGSGLPGSILKELRDFLNLPLPILLWKDYGLPSHPFKHPLVLCISFSGETAETISAFHAARRAGHSLAVIAGGGKLLRLAGNHHIPCATFPHGDLTAREAIGYTWTSVQCLLKAYFPSLRTGDLSKIIRPKTFEQAGKKLASSLKGSVPLVYAESAYGHVGYIWKINLNETGKISAFSHVIPEMVHNEIAGFETAPKMFVPLFLLDRGMNSKLSKKVKMVQAILKKRGFRILSVPLIGKTPEEKTLNSIILSHWTALSIAKQNRKDPSSTAIINEIKQRVASQ